MSYLLATALAAAGLVPLLRHHRRRTRLHRALAGQRSDAIARYRPRLQRAVAPPSLRAEFVREHIVRVAEFLDGETLKDLQAEAAVNRVHAERSYLPGHKKGGTLSYEAVHRNATGCLALYHSEALQHWLSDLVGAALEPTADHDQSSCSLLYYDRPGDHIGWHYDHNFYRGRHFTVLISLTNRSSGGGPSAGRLECRKNGRISVVDTCENTLVVFEGAKVFHRATPIRADDERVMLSMTFCTDPHIGLFKELARRVKDTAYFGPRVLFD